MIDWHFIKEFEGERLTGYVPDPDGSSSGVTVGAGVDLGQLDHAELHVLPGPLQAVLQPYIGLRGQAAVQFLQSHPLTLSAADVEALDAVVEGEEITPMLTTYLKDTGNSFDTLPDAVQTVVASVTFQYGTPWVRCPKFWETAVNRNFPAMVACLNNFGDRYGTRRKSEASYLEKTL